MEVDQALEFCNSLKYSECEYKEAWESYVLKVGEKVFAFIPENYDSVYYIMLKCDPEEAVSLRESYEGVEPAYHMNKKHWNMVRLKSDVSDKEIKREIENSYNLVYNKLTKRVKEELREK